MSILFCSKKKVKIKSASFNALMRLREKKIYSKANIWESLGNLFHLSCFGNQEVKLRLA